MSSPEDKKMMCDEGRKWTANEVDVMVSSVCLRTADFLRVM
jgi:hypothetical protein